MVSAANGGTCEPNREERSCDENNSNQQQQFNSRPKNTDQENNENISNVEMDDIDDSLSIAIGVGVAILFLLLFCGISIWKITEKKKHSNNNNSNNIGNNNNNNNDNNINNNNSITIAVNSRLEQQPGIYSSIRYEDKVEGGGKYQTMSMRASPLPQSEYQMAPETMEPEDEYDIFTTTSNGNEAGNQKYETLTLTETKIIDTETSSPYESSSKAFEL